MCAEFIVAVEGMVSLSRCSSSLVIRHWVCESNFKGKNGTSVQRTLSFFFFPPLSFRWPNHRFNFRFINAMESCPEYLGYFDVSVRISSESAS